MAHLQGEWTKEDWSDSASAAVNELAAEDNFLRERRSDSRAMFVGAPEIELKIEEAEDVLLAHRFSRAMAFSPASDAESTVDVVGDRLAPPGPNAFAMVILYGAPTLHITKRFTLICWPKREVILTYVRDAIPFNFASRFRCYHRRRFMGHDCR